jgi:hypothetical protein
LFQTLCCCGALAGKERLFLEAARVLQRKVYVSATKRKVGSLAKDCSCAQAL